MNVLEQGKQKQSFTFSTGRSTGLKKTCLVQVHHMVLIVLKNTYLFTTVCVCMCACVCAQLCLFATPWTIAHQAPLSMEFSKQEYWRELSFSALRDLPNPGIKPSSLVSPTLAGRFFTTNDTCCCFCC